MRIKAIITFIIVLVVSFFAVGYLKDIRFIQTEWLPGTTLLQKIWVYYSRNLFENIIYSLLIATVVIGATIVFNRKRHS